MTPTEGITYISIEDGYRLKHLPTGQYYNPARGTLTKTRKGPIGHLYSKRGVISLLSYQFRFFLQAQDEWEILEYDVGDEVELIDKIPLKLWTEFEKIKLRREK